MMVESVQVGSQSAVDVGDRTIETGIDKRPVPWATLTAAGLRDDVVANTKHHGGPDQAVYVYLRNDYRWWEAQLSVPLPAGRFGENLTIDGLDSASLRIGDLLAIDGVELEVTAPRIPCAVFSVHMGDAGFRDRFRAARRPGAYCRVLRGGELRAGARVAWHAAPAANVSLLEVFDLHYDRRAGAERLRAALGSPVAGRVRADLEGRLERAGSG